MYWREIRPRLKFRYLVGLPRPIQALTTWALAPKLQADAFASRSHRARLAAARLYRPIAVGLTVVLLGLYVVEVVYAWTHLGWGFAFGNDLRIYTEATSRLFSDGSWYLDRQMHGPYELAYGDVLYPPVASFFFAPFIVLPTAVYLLIPITVVAWLVATWRPSPWAWPLIALFLVWPLTTLKATAGNPSMYVAMFVGLGLRYRWPGVFVLLKPSLGPFALIGIFDRRWWFGLAVLALGSLPFLAQTIAWPTVALDAVGGGLYYSLLDLPMVLIPTVAWLARSRFQDQRLAS